MKIRVHYLYSLLALTIFCINPNVVSAQLFFSNHEIEEMFYEAHVKSLDEFIERFNGNELNIFASKDQLDKVRATRFSLFNFELLRGIQPNDTIPSIYEEFVNDIASDSLELSIENPNNWIEAQCSFKWKGIPKTLSIQLQLEEDENHYWRWCVIGVKGLEESGLLKEDGILSISPVDHELNFLGLESLFLNDAEKFVRTKKTGIHIDSLSFFYGLVTSGVLKFNQCERVEFHCRQFPGYYFIVTEILRTNTTNSGWLIVSLNKTNKSIHYEENSNNPSRCDDGAIDIAHD